MGDTEERRSPTVSQEADCDRALSSEGHRELINLKNERTALTRQII